MNNPPERPDAADIIDGGATNGGIQPGKEVVSYDKLVDRSVWRDAAALMKKP